MTGQTPSMNPYEVEALVIARAREDAAFKQELLRNPKAVLEREQGQPLPENIEVRALEETPNSLYVILPNSSQREEVEETLRTSDPEELRVQLLSRALRDEAFKQQLLTDARAAVQVLFDEVGVEYQLPEELELNFLEETENIRYLVLPIREEEELSDSELEAVAGGGKSPVFEYPRPIALYGVSWSRQNWLS